MGTEKARPTHVLVRWLARVVLVLAIIIAVLALLVPLIVILPATQNYITSLATGALSDALGAEVRIGGASLALSGRISVYDAVIRARPTSPNAAESDSTAPDSIAAESITARLDYLALLNRTVSIGPIRVRGLRAKLVRYPDGHLGPFRFPTDTSSSSAPAWEVDLGAVLTQGAQAVYIDEPARLRAELEGLNARVDFYRLDSLHVEAEASYGYVSIAGTSLDSLILSFNSDISATALVITSTEIANDQLQASAEGTLSFADTATVKADVSVRADHGFLRELHPSLKPLGSEGATHVEAHLSGPLDAPLWQAHINTERAQWKHARVAEAHAQATFDANDQVSGTLDLDAASHGSARAEFAVGLPHLYSDPSIGSYFGDAHIARLDLPWLLRLFDSQTRLPHTRASATVRVRGAGTSTPPSSAELDGNAVFSDTAIPGDTLRYTLELDGGAWTARTSWGSNQVEGSGTLRDWDDVSGSATAQLDNPAFITQWLLDEPVKGTATAEASFRYSSSAGYHVEASMTTDSLAWSGVTVREFDGRVQFDTSGVYVDQARAEGRVVLKPLLKEFDTEGVTGEGTFRVHATGALSSPLVTAFVEVPEMHARSLGTYHVICSVALANDTVRWYDVSVSDSMVELATTGYYGIQHQSISADVSAAIPDGESGTIRAQGSVAPESLAVQIHGSDIPVGLAHVLWTDRDLPAGAVAFDIDVSGRLANPAVRFGIEAPSLQFREEKSISVQARGLMNDSLLESSAEVKMTEPEALLTMQATVPFMPSDGWRLHSNRPDQRPEASWMADSFEIRMIELFIPPTLSVEGIALTEGTVWADENGDWHVKGSANLHDGAVRFEADSLQINTIRVRADLDGALQKPQGTFTCSTGTVDHRESPEIVRRIVAWGRLDQTHIVLDTAKVEMGDEGHAIVTGRAPLPSAENAGGIPPFDITYRITELPLPLFSPFIPSVSVVEGIVSGDGTVSYSRSGTDLQGGLRAERLKVDIEDIRPEIGPVTVVVRFDGDTAHMDTLRAEVRGGKVWANGWAVLMEGGAFPLWVSLRAKRAGVSIGAPLDIRVDTATLYFDNLSRRGYTLSGSVTLGHSEYELPISIADITSYLRRSPYATAPTTMDSLLDAIHLNVDVSTASPLTVDVDIARIKSEVNVLVKGTMAKPRLTGNASITKGTVRYLGTQFDVTRGIFQLHNPSQFNPSLNIEAQTEVSPSGGLRSATNYRVTLRVTGTLEKPGVHLTSNPPLSQVDIASLLTLGMVRNADEELLAIESGSHLANALAEKAKVLASQPITGYATRRLERWLRLDDVSVQGNLFALGGKNGPRVTVSKRFRDRLTLTYESVIGDIETQTIQARFKIVPHVFLQGQTNAKDNAALDLKLRWSF